MHFSAANIGSFEIEYCLDALLRATQIKFNDQKQLVVVSPPFQKKQSVSVCSKSMRV